MESLEQDEKLVVKFLDYYDYDGDKIREMLDDMYQLVPSDDRPRLIDLIADIIRNEQRTHKIRSASKQSRDNYKRNGNRIEDYIKPGLYIRTGDVNFTTPIHEDGDAIKEWFYKLHPRFSLQEVTNGYRAEMSRLCQYAIEKLDPAIKLKCEQYAKRMIEFLNFNIGNQLEGMTRYLSRTMYRKTKGVYNLPQQMCKQILQNISVDALRTEVSRTKTAPARNIPNKFIDTVYTYMEEKRGLPPTRYGVEKVLFKKVYRFYSADKVKKRVFKYFKDKSERELKEVVCSKSAAADAKNEANEANLVVASKGEASNNARPTWEVNASGNLSGSMTVTALNDNSSGINDPAFDKGGTCKPIELSTDRRYVIVYKRVPKEKEAASDAARYYQNLVRRPDGSLPTPPLTYRGIGTLSPKRQMGRSINKAAKSQPMTSRPTGTLPSRRQMRRSVDEAAQSQPKTTESIPSDDAAGQSQPEKSKQQL